MTPPASIIRQLLIALGVGNSSGSWSVFTGFLPDSPDNAIVVYDTAGTVDGRIMRSGEKIEHEGIQVRVRGPVYPTVWSKINEVVALFDSLEPGTTVAIGGDGTYAIQNVSRTGAVIPLGVEEEGDRRRHHFTLNAVITMRKLE